jgi:hypothetical protein
MGMKNEEGMTAWSIDWLVVVVQAQGQAAQVLWCSSLMRRYFGATAKLKVDPAQP